MNRTNICVLGCGYWGRNLVRTFHALGCLRAVCDEDITRAEQMAESFPGVRVLPGHDAVLNDSDIDAVAIATPAECHYQLAMQSLAAGKDVFVEKPLALDWQDGLEMTAEAHKQRRILMVGHLLHYHPGVVALKLLVNKGTLGRIEYIYSNRLSMGKIRREENALWSFAPHDISLILSLVGQTPLQAVATGGAYLQPNIADVTMSSMLFDRGTRAHVFVSWLHPYKEQRLVVIGSKQMAVFEDSRTDRKLMLFNKQIELKGRNLEAVKPLGTEVMFENSEPLLVECSHFLECVAHRKRPNTPGEEGVEVLKVLQACQMSLQLNGEPVQVTRAQQRVAAL
jgi:UDP-2-acetamido-3-amino-2,3-dideoxy-glucuronate N-acetyltransferase